MNWCYIWPGKPVENAYAESFIRRLRNKFLNETLFLNLAQAREELATWRNEYNYVRPHGALGWRTPAECWPCRFVDKPDGLPTNRQGQQPQVLFSMGLIGEPTPGPTVRDRLEGLS